MSEPTFLTSSGDFPGCVLIYDGTCRLCVTAKQGIEQLQAESRPNVRMIPYQSDEAKKLLGNKHQPGRPDVAYLADPQGRISQGLDAFLYLLPGLKGGRFLAALFRIPFAKSIGQLIYRGIARYRYRLFGEVPLESPDPYAFKSVPEKLLP